MDKRTKGERGGFVTSGGWTFMKQRDKGRMPPKNVICILVLCLPVWLLLVTLDPKHSELNGYYGYSHVLDTELSSLHMLSYLISMDIPLNVWKWDHFYFI